MRRIAGMLGLGDNFYQRAVVRELGPVELTTSWPQLYADLPVRCVRPVTNLRTQTKNALAAPGFVPATGPATERMGYGATGTMLQGLCSSVGVRSPRLDFSGPPTTAKRSRTIVVRPATVREEWRADARNPKPEHIAEAIELLRHDFHIISIADLAPGKEWAVGPLPFAHERYHAGELSLSELLALVSGAAGAVGGVGWLTPACVAYGVPKLLLFGGWGASNGPQRIFDPRMDTSAIVQAAPDQFCRCNNRFHACPRHISNLEDYVERFYRLAEARAAGVDAGVGGGLVSCGGVAV